MVNFAELLQVLLNLAQEGVHREEYLNMAGNYYELKERNAKGEIFSKSDAIYLYLYDADVCFVFVNVTNCINRINKGHVVPIDYINSSIKSREEYVKIREVQQPTIVYLSPLLYDMIYNSFYNIDPLTISDIVKRYFFVDGTPDEVAPRDHDATVVDYMNNRLPNIYQIIVYEKQNVIPVDYEDYFYFKWESAHSYEYNARIIPVLHWRKITFEEYGTKFNEQLNGKNIINLPYVYAYLLRACFNI